MTRGCAVLLLALAACSGDNTATAQSKPTPVPPVRAEADIPDSHYGSPHVRAVYANRIYDVREAMTDAGWAQTLLLARYAGNRSGVQTAYTEDGYLQFEPPVRCKVSEQDSRGPMDPIACVVQGGEHAGETVYATDIETGF